MSAGVELWLIRHGETEWSLDGRHTSTTDIPLTEHGRQRALELKEYLAGKKFAAVFVSPRQRALETCRLAGYCLLYTSLELFKAERAVVHGGGQAESVVDEVLFARAVAVPHAVKLRDGDVGLVDEEQVVAGERCV